MIGVKQFNQDRCVTDQMTKYVTSKIPKIISPVADTAFVIILR